MPLYDFICKTCNEQYELFLPIDHPEQHCVKCQALLEKLFSVSKVLNKQKGNWNNPNFHKTMAPVSIKKGERKDATIISEE